jgi:phage-related protein
MDAAISWEGDSREVLSDFAVGVKSTLGFGLRRLQQGKTPACACRPIQSIGEGVFELKAQDERAWHRVIYLSRIDDVIYVLHSFKKQGRKTSGPDLRTARSRLKLVNQRLMEAKKRRKK